MFNTKRNFIEKLLRKFTIENFKRVINAKCALHLMGIQNDRFITGKSRKLNRLSKSAHVTDKKLHKIRSIDRGVSF